MARYPFHGLGRLRAWSRNRIYVISALLVVAVVFAFMYGRHPSDRDQDEGQPVEALPTTDTQTVEEVEKEIIPPVPPLAAEAKAQPESMTSSSTPTAESGSKVTEIIAKAIALVNEKPGKVIEARDRLNDVLLMCESSQQQKLVKDQLSKLAVQWLFSKSLFANDRLCGSYKVKPGDQLRIIGQLYKVPYQVLMQINNIQRPQALKAGDTIKVINGPFHAKIYRSRFTMDLYLQNTYVCSFPVGLGKPGRETPTGLWRVKKGGKMEKPTWRDPDTNRIYQPNDPDYPLGSRWIELQGMEGNAKDQTGFGIHGTKEPETIGVAESRGCIRLHNGHAILLYNLLVPIHSHVRVEE